MRPRLPAHFAIETDRTKGHEPDNEQTTRLLAASGNQRIADGLTEAENDEGEQFTRERLARLVAAHKDKTAQELMELIYTTAVGFKGSETFDDDLTLIVLKADGDDGHSEK